MNRVLTIVLFVLLTNLSYGQKTNWYLRIAGSFPETTNVGFRVSEDSCNYKLGLDIGGFRYYRSFNAVYQQFLKTDKPYYFQGDAGVAVKIDPEWFDPTFFLIAGLRAGYEHKLTKRLALDINFGGFTVIRQDQTVTDDMYPYRTHTITSYPFRGRVAGSLGLLIKLN